MFKKLIGSRFITHVLKVGLRILTGYNAEALSAQKDLDLNSKQYQRFTAASTQDVVLPDATTLENGWDILISIPGSSGSSIDVKTYHATTPVQLQNIVAGRAYRFYLDDNGDAAGTWVIDYLEKADLVASPRHVHTHDATTSWPAASGGSHTMVVTEATHGKGTAPKVQTEEGSGSDFVALDVNTKTLANGDVQVIVPETPDGRYAGRVIIS